MGFPCVAFKLTKEMAQMALLEFIKQDFFGIVGHRVWADPSSSSS